MTRGRARYIEAEPCTINSTVVAEFLEQIEWERAAAHVRRLGTRDAELGREVTRWRDAYRDVLKRLHQYEPPTPEPATASGRPDWTCDG